MALQKIDLNLSNGKRRPFWHRGGQADLGAIQQIFNAQDYSLKRLARGRELRARYDALLAAGQKPLVVDAGSNIGASVVWLAHFFNGSHVVAFEPDAANFEVMIRNVQGLDVQAYRAAVGSEDGRVSLVDPGQGEWAYRTRADPAGGCPLVSLPRIVAEKVAAGYAPFLIKIDIEGGEDNLFQKDTGWIDLFPILIIELHDWAMPRQGTSRNFIRCIGQYDRDFIYINENVFSLKNS